jgi:hypothetical protein
MASEAFTRTTIEMITSDARQELVHATAMMPVRRRSWRLQVAAICAAGVVLGFTLLWLILPNPNRTLYANLPTIEQVDVYGAFRDVDFLRQLHQSSPWLREGERGEQAKQQAATIAQLTEASYRERKEYVEQLDPSQQSSLANKTRRYRELSSEAQRELTDRYEEIRTASDGQQLQQTAFAYYAWLSQFSEVEQAKLGWLDTKDRLAEIAQMNERLVARQDRELTPANANGLREALQVIYDDPEIKRLQEDFFTNLPNRDRSDEGREEFIRRSRDEVNRRTITFVLRMVEQEDKPLPPAAAELRKAVEERLLAGLDQKTADELRSRPAPERGWMLSAWLWNLRRERPDVATLEAYLQSGKFTQEEQYELLSMPNDEMYRALERLYMEDQMGEDRERGGRRRGEGFRDWGRFDGPPFEEGGERRGDDDERRGRGRRDREGEERGEMGPRNGPGPPLGGPQREFSPDGPRGDGPGRGGPRENGPPPPPPEL